MYRYTLNTKDGEAINMISAVDLAAAEEFFAKIKSLSIEDLLKIYNVDIFNDKK
jgi:hypothetical protein